MTHLANLEITDRGIAALLSAYARTLCALLETAPANRFREIAPNDADRVIGALADLVAEAYHRTYHQYSLDLTPPWTTEER